MKRSCFVHVVRLGIVARGITFVTRGKVQFICSGARPATSRKGSPAFKNRVAGNVAFVSGDGSQKTATATLANPSGNGSFNTASRDNVL